MQLQPRRPPGRTDRKAAAYASEIARLRAEGYTYEAIREALADVGIQLSTSALRREVHRPRHQVESASSLTRSVSRTSTVVRFSPPQSPSRLSSGVNTSGREIAQAFFNAHPSNPLMRAQEIQ